MKAHFYVIKNNSGIISCTHTLVLSIRFLLKLSAVHFLPLSAYCIRVYEQTNIIYSPQASSCPRILGYRRIDPSFVPSQVLEKAGGSGWEGMGEGWMDASENEVTYTSNNKWGVSLSLTHLNVASILWLVHIHTHIMDDVNSENPQHCRWV